QPCCCQCCCGPTFEFRADGVALKRNNPGNVPFLFDPATGFNFFNQSQFRFDFEPGVDASVIAYINPCVSVEARYLALFDTNDEVVTGPFTVAGAALPVFYNTTPPTAVTLPIGSTLISADYDSKLQSGEISLRGRATPWLTVLGGFRYLNLRERFHARLDFTPAVGAIAPVDFSD